MNIRDFVAEEKLFRYRALTAFGLVVVCFAILIVNLWHVQVQQHQYYQTRSDSNDIKTILSRPDAALFTIATASRW